MIVSRLSILASGLAGVLAIIAYLLVAIGGFLPQWVRDVLGISIGPLAIVGLLGLHTTISVYRDTMAARIGTLFSIIGAAILNIYTVVQKANWRWHEAALQRGDSDLSEAVFYAVDRVQGAMDVSFDIFILTGLILLAVSMLSHPKFHSLVALGGILLAAGTLFLNLWTFPMPPDQAGLIDLGPLVGLWLLLVFGRTASLSSWAAKQPEISSELHQ